MPAKLPRAIVYLFLAYWIVTLLGILLTIFFGWAYALPSAEALGVSVARSPAYLLTLPYHPLLNLGVWPWFGLWYLRAVSPAAARYREALRLAAFWTVVTILVDLVGWVLIQHPWSMTWREFYVDYQPWITLIYAVIFASPVLAAWWLGRPAALGAYGQPGGF